MYVCLVMKGLLTKAANLISFVFFPGTMVLLGLFKVATQMSIYEWIVCLMALIVLPLVQILLFLKMGKIKDVYMSNRNERHISYLTILGLGIIACVLLYVNKSYNELQVWIAAITLVNVLLLVVNNFIKASAHAAASAGFMAFMYNWDPFERDYWWVFAAVLWLLVLVSRKILKAHTWQELGLGSFLGFFCTFVARQLPWI